MRLGKFRLGHVRFGLVRFRVNRLGSNKKNFRILELKKATVLFINYFCVFKTNNM